ncbi:MAG: response regulator, partial [Pseudomonadota bacterium]
GQKGKKIKSHPGQISGMNVLCIDNDQSILDGMSVLLSEWGCYVSIASDEQEAINCVKEAVVPPDIILADYHLDNTTGISVFRRLQKIAPEVIPGVLITADRTTEVKSRAENAGMTVLNKPVKPAALRAIISRHKPVQAAAE